VNDRDWEDVWEGTLDRVERYRINRSTWRRELPADALERRLVPERARRLRRGASRHALFHLLWILFWGSIAVVADPAEGPAETLSAGMAAFSLVVVAGCLVVRRYLEPVTRYG
jgi:TRAP-type C4-dicarboxylate transport system permease small subunit